MVVLLAALCVVLSGCVVVGSGAGRTTAPPSAPPPAAGSAAPAEERMAREVFDRVDDERRNRGLPPVGWSDQLAAVARDWSATMAETGRFEHQDLGAVLGSAEVEGLRAMGENIATTSAPVPAGVLHTGWMRSDEHRANVLNPGFDRLGVGVVCAADGSVWATQEFGRTVSADLPAIASEPPPQEPIARAGEDGPRCP
ncbi:CAP domain-containing protein [Geodermatophilus pulveris]|uniref:CAP domain-containing protein n=1 Tax=Geodermatophilus pulveris TaxID=1564159 RepID=UPI001FE573D7|nr:CAP domain-containing protein [Geodermatophilus pulveris]